MGAKSAKPQTINMSNSSAPPPPQSRPAAFVITQDVVDRIENAFKPKPPVKRAIYCENCKQNARMRNAETAAQATTQTVASESEPSTMEHYHHQKHSWSSMQRRSNEKEESQYTKTKNRINELFGRPVKWAKDCTNEISEMEAKLVACYKNNPTEPLACAPLAKQFHNFVFSKHYDALRKAHHLTSGDSEEDDDN